MSLAALLFDCDGVIVDTERDGHRVAFNRAFKDAGLNFTWDETVYGELLLVAGGKERMLHYFDAHGWPERAKDRDAFIRELHRSKTDHFMNIIDSGELPLRSGVARLMDEAFAAHVPVFICSTSHERAVNLVAERMLGPERKERMMAILAGDVVRRKKPDREIYLLPQGWYGLISEDCMVVEDSRNGLLAAKGAGMRCIVTKSTYTQDEDFSEADLVVAELGDPPGECVTLETLEQLIKTRA